MGYAFGRDLMMPQILKNATCAGKNPEIASKQTSARSRVNVDRTSTDRSCLLRSLDLFDRSKRSAIAKFLIFCYKIARTTA